MNFESGHSPPCKGGEAAQRAVGVVRTRLDWTLCRSLSSDSRIRSFEIIFCVQISVEAESRVAERRSIKLFALTGVGALLICSIPLAIMISGGAFRVTTDSMYPTLGFGERVFAGASVGIDRGDLIVFRYPLDRTKSYIKRAIGVGGDTVEIRDGQIIINGVPVHRRRIEAPCVEEVECTIWMEALGSRTYMVAFQNELPSPEYGF